MREILFRGFHPDKNGKEKVFVNGKWINGFWAHGYYVKAKYHWHKYGIHEDFIISSCFQNGGYFNVCQRYSVIPETVGQYTGLKDKNGKKIFEGDIVHCWYEDYSGIGLDSEFYAVVQFGNPSGDYTWGYQLRAVKGDKTNYDILLWVEMEDARAYCEVIGNIFEIPELLKGGEE